MEWFSLSQDTYSIRTQPKSGSTCFILRYLAFLKKIWVVLSHRKWQGVVGVAKQLLTYSEVIKLIIMCWSEFLCKVSWDGPAIWSTGTSAAIMLYTSLLIFLFNISNLSFQIIHSRPVLQHYTKYTSQLVHFHPHKRDAAVHSAGPRLLGALSKILSGGPFSAFIKKNKRPSTP